MNFFYIKQTGKNNLPVSLCVQNSQADPDLPMEKYACYYPYRWGLCETRSYVL